LQTAKLAESKNWNTERFRKIFLSRVNYRNSGRALGMAAVENVMRASGIEVIRPEELPISQQVLNILQSDEIYCEAGSALHLLDTLGPQDLRLVILSRRGQDGNYWRNLYQDRIKSVVSFDHVFPLHDYLGTSPGDGHSLIHSRKIAEFLDRSGLKIEKNSFIEDLVLETKKDMQELGIQIPRI
jgi:hypothetical protein